MLWLIAATLLATADGDSAAGAPAQPTYTLRPELQIGADAPLGLARLVRRAGNLGGPGVPRHRGARAAVRKRGSDGPERGDLRARCADQSWRARSREARPRQLGLRAAGALLAAVAAVGTVICIDQSSNCGGWVVLLPIGPLAAIIVDDAFLSRAAAP